jgi:F-type H+-transporting ATPase subunit alpha
MSKNTELQLNTILSKFLIDNDYENTLNDYGIVTSVGDGIAKITGLEDVQAGELVVFNNNIRGMTLNLEKNSVRAVVFGNDSDILQGDFVTRTFSIVSVVAGEVQLGHVLDSLGNCIDGSN